MKNLKITDKLRNSAYPIFTFAALILLWQYIVVSMKVPSYIVPSPLDIAYEFRDDWAILLMHSRATLIEAALGIVISVAIALVIGIVMDFLPIVRKCLYPIMYITQMIPTITIAPLLIIWFGFGIKSKVLCVILTCFFPILINFMDGMEGVDRDYLNLFRTMKANRLQTFIHLKFPMSLDKFFTGLKISSTYAFVAATVAEWLGGTAGLGVYMVRAKNSYALDKVFACTILVVVYSLLFIGIFSIIKKIALRNYN